jgi:hypothetical protein
MNEATNETHDFPLVLMFLVKSELQNERKAHVYAAVFSTDN